MPSPFPGMDPFLEDPTFFHPIHQRLIYLASEQLQSRLPEPYFVELEDRVWIEASTPHQAVPDANVLRAGGPSRRQESSGGIAVAEVIQATPVVIRIPHVEVSEWYLNVYAKQKDGEQLVATIEILSESNKTPGATGRDLYLRKQKEILSGKVHLVEIDLLRRGQHATCVPLASLKAAIPDFDYHVCIKHFDNLEDYFVFPIRLTEPLPKLPIPLLPGDGTVPLDLQAAFDRAYEVGPYRFRVPYVASVPAPALSDERVAWVKKVLHDKGVLALPTA